MEDLEQQVRQQVYTEALASGRVPSASALAGTLASDVSAVRERQHFQVHRDLFRVRVRAAFVQHDADLRAPAGIVAALRGRVVGG